MSLTTIRTVLVSFALAMTACAAAGSDTVPTSAVTSPTASRITTTTTSRPPVTTTKPAPTTAPSSTTTTTTATPIADPHVEVGGARLVYRCEGTGPTVIIEQGLAGTNPPEWVDYMGWGRVFEGRAEMFEGLTGDFQVCIYNRRGVGTSDPAPRAGVTTEDQVDDLVKLIEALGVDTPVVLVGHSIGGFNIRVFADQHPELLLGAVFVDSSTPFQDQAMGISVPLGAAPPEYLDIGVSEAQVAAAGSMGDTPIVVLTALRGLSENDQPIWTELHVELAKVSSVSRHEILEDSSHLVYINRADAIIDAVLWVFERA